MMKDGKDYSLRKISESYEKNRFSGEGGRYVSSVERLFLHDMIMNSKGKFLDLACGTGRVAKFIDMNGQDVVGVDLSLEMLLQAKASMSAPMLQGDVFSLPFVNSAFDIVIAYRLFYFIDNLQAFLGEVNRVLKDGGIFVFNACNSYSTRGILNLFFRLFNADRGIRLTTHSKVRHVLDCCGFETLEDRQEFSLPLNSYRLYSGRLLTLVQHLDRIAPKFLRVMLFVKCRKKSQTIGPQLGAAKTVVGGMPVS
jgi:ubiquinone/menaquinone biosynthesis C-methylase UbiE